MSDSLLLKWGTVKQWDFESADSKAFKLLQKFLHHAPVSCMLDRPDEKRKKLLCDVIDAFNGKIQNDWTGEKMTKEQAKDYVMNYGRNQTDD